MISDFLITCSGASRDVLNECKTERVKFISIGATVLLTSILASISAAYFLYFVFSDKQTGELQISLFALGVFGVLWGFLIFSLDRSIIVSIRKTNNLKDELTKAWPRIILAIFIGFVIATPLELRLFQAEIEEKMNMELKIKLSRVKEQNNLFFRGDSLRLSQEMMGLQEELFALKIKRDSSNSYLNAEMRTGYRKKSEKHAAENQRLDKLIDDQNKKINSKDNELKEYFREQTIRDRKDEEIISRSKGPEARITALYQLSNLHWFVTFLFILLETLPIISKVMSNRGPYDEILVRIESEVAIEQTRLIEQKKYMDEILLNEKKELEIKASEMRILKETELLSLEREVTSAYEKYKAEKEIQLNKERIDQWYIEQINFSSNKEPKTFNTPKKIGITNKQIKETAQNKVDEHINDEDEKNVQEKALEFIPDYLINKDWKSKTRNIIYRFIISGSDHVLKYKEENQCYNGMWTFEPAVNELSITLFKNTEIYKLKKLTFSTLTLADQHNNLIELI